MSRRRFSFCRDCTALLLVDDSFASACLFPRARYAPNELLVLLFAVEQCRFLTRQAAIIPRSFVRSRSLARSLAKEILQSPQFERLHRRRPLTSSRLFSTVDTFCLTFFYLAEKVRTMCAVEREKKGTTCQFLKEPKDLNATALRTNGGEILDGVWNDLETVEIKRSP